jgi:hypothetical protein
MIEPWTPLTECELSTRALHALAAEGCTTVQDILSLPTMRWPGHPYNLEKTIKSMPNVGPGTAREILAMLAPILTDPDDIDAREFHEWCIRNRPVLEILRRGLP